MSEGEIYIEETFQPVGLAHEESEAEVVVCLTVDAGREAWQGREFGDDEIVEAVEDGAEIEMSLQFGISKVALEGEKVEVVVIAGSECQVVELVGLLLICARHREVADTQAALGVIQVTGREVGVDIARED